MNSPAKEFLRSAAQKAADVTHRQMMLGGLEHYAMVLQRGRARFADWEAARQRCQEIKWKAINHLDRYLLEFEQHVEERGGHVFWAETAEEARNYIIALAGRHGVHKVVKSKSMVTEEIHLSSALEKHGIEVFETDLGEFIVQLRHEPPYHIIMPAVHLTIGQIAELFKEKLGDVSSQDAQELAAAARRALRRAFFSAEMGITGANFLVADCGMVAITTNEGNARLGTSLPRIHVAVTGIEKVIPRLQDLAVLWPVLATAATGQHLASYNTLIGGPRAPGEPDGPDEFHVVLLDDGRSELLADAEQREVLHCIRCGACLNVCPVFRTVGGHAYGTPYSGPIGSVLTPHLRGLAEFQHLSYASSLCGACTDTCPVRIDLHRHLLQNRRNAIDAGTHSWRERLGFTLWRWTMLDAQRFRLLGWVFRAIVRFVHAIGMAGSMLDPMRAWTKHRAAPPIPAKSFRALWRARNGAP